MRYTQYNLLKIRLEADNH